VKPDTTTYTVTPAEARWVQGELVRDLMRTQRNTQPLGMLLVPLLLVLLWQDIPPGGLLAWTVVTTAAALARFAVLRLYKRDVLDGGADAHIAFLRRWWLVWPASSVAWGASVLLFFDRAPLQDQFICWLALAGLAMFAIATLSSHLRTMRHCLDALAVSALAAMAWHMGVELRFGGPVQHWWMVVLLLVFWQVLRTTGLRQHLTLRKNYELRYRNNQLIESLTRQTQAALDAVEIKNRFLASAAHDIRQPVHALGLYADWLGSEPEMVHEIAPKIVDATKAVNALFDSLFDVARLDSGKIRLTIEPVWLDKLLHDLELQYRPLAEAKGLAFRVHSVPGTVTTDPILLQRIVGNLIANAVKYTEHGGVLVAARRTARGPCIEIWDTGVGIAPAYQREIFREFYKVPGHAGTEDGFGLGLYIVSRLCHILGHPLQLASRPGRGTVFRLLVQSTDPAQAMQRVTRLRAARVEVVSTGPAEPVAQS
jgi:signal transduction histidine kinase